MNRSERGSASVELVLLVPLLMAMVALVVAAGRIVDARGQVNDAAYAAARAASLETNEAAAHRAGQAAAREALAERGRACVRLSVSLTGTDFRTDGSVVARVTCRADLGDVAGFGLPGAKRISARAVAPIEQHRRLP